MTDLEKKIIAIARKHGEFDEAKVVAELADMNAKDSDLVRNLYSLYTIAKERNQIGSVNPRQSVLAYYMGITSVAPDVLFNLDKRRTYGRSGFPDIDMDFDYLRRHEIVEYLIEKYGREYVGNIGNVQTFKTKASVRRAIKVLDPTSSIRFDENGREIKGTSNENFALENEILRTLPGLMKRGDGSAVGTVQEAYEEYTQFSEYMDKYPEIMRIAKGIEGTVGGFGVHAAGILLSPIPLSQIAPLHVTTSHGAAAEDGPKKVTATQFPMGDVERLGLIKFDVLGLSTKTAINWACKYIKEEKDITINWDHIRMDDEETLSLLHGGKTDGCFQLENPGMKECLKQIGIDTFDDLIVAVAMYRPGPKDYIPEFSGRKQGRVPVSYPDPRLKEITQGTHGILVYQEQVMKAFMALADLTASDGYDFMKGCAKKKMSLIEAYKEKFFKGALSLGIKESVLTRIWADLHKFSGYAFNKSLQWDEKIITTKQECSIQELYNMKQRGEELPQAFSPTGDPVDIVDVYDHGILPVYEITFDDGSSVSSTLNHKFMTSKGVLPLHQILNENLEVVQNLGAIHEQMGMQRVSDPAKDSSKITESSTGVRKVSSGEIQSKALCMQGMQRGGSGLQGTSCSQEKLSELERLEKPTLQQAEQNKWSQGLGADFTRSPASKRMESKDQPIGAASYRYPRRKETSFRVNEAAQQKAFCEISTKQSKNSDQNVSQKRHSREESRSAEKMEGRASRRVLSPVYCETREESVEIERGDIFARNFGAVGLPVQSICVQRGVPDKVSTSSSGLYLERSKDHCRVRWGTALSKRIPRRFSCSTGERQEIQQSLGRARLFSDSNFLRYMVIEQEEIQISAISRIVNNSAVLLREKHNQNNWQSLRIQKIKFVGYEQCYDLEIASDDHLYCLANGVVNSNSHSVSYAYESYKTAYLKAHYPTEFISARLSVETIRRNFDDVDKYERDAVKNFAFTIKEPDLNNSKLHWSIIGDKELLKPLLVKGIGIKAAEEIVKHQPFRGKDLLYAFTMKVGKAVTSKVMESMKDAGFWSGISKEKLIKNFEQIKQDKKKTRGRPTMDLFG